MNLIKSTLRSLYKFRLYSTINLFGLVLGFTCSFAIILYAGFELSFDKFHKDKENIFRVKEVFTSPEEKEINPRVRIPVGPDLKKEYPEIEDFTRITNRGWKKQLIAGENELSVSNVLIADENFFDFFSFKLLVGSANNVLRGVNSIVLTKRISDRLFGNYNPIGQTINCNNKSYTITGVAENAPLNSHIQFDVVFPLAPVINSPDMYISWRGGMVATTFVKLNKNASKSDIEAKLPDLLWEKINKDSGEGFETMFYLEPLEKIHLFSDVDWDIFDRKEAKNVITLLVIGCFVFIVALINYLFISNATISVRLKQFNIRKYLGIGKYGVLNLIFTETIVLLSISGFISIILLIYCNPYISQLFGSDFIQFQLINALPFLLTFILITCLFITLVQYIFYKKSINGISVIISNNLPSKNKRLAYISAFQFCISIALISSMIIVYKQLHFALNKDLGFSSQNIINITDGSITKKSQMLIDEFKKIPGVINASSSFGIPGLESTRNGYRPEGTDQWHMFNALHIDKNFFETYQIQIINGRNFNEITSINNKPCIVNETLANKLNWDNPIGKYLFREGNYEIIGVVRDFHLASMFHKIPPLVISQEYQEDFYTLSISMRSDNLPYTIKQIEKKWNAVNPDVPFTYSFLDDLFGKLYTETQKTAKLLLIFTGISILISILGLFGITFLILNTRIKEIGIRKINGAKISDILAMVNTAFIKWISIAYLVATPLSWFVMQKWLENFAYKTRLSWWIFALAGLVALGIALITVSWQSWRAAKRNPVEALRYE